MKREEVGETANDKVKRQSLIGLTLCCIISKLCLQLTAHAHNGTDTYTHTVRVATGLTNPSRDIT